MSFPVQPKEHYQSNPGNLLASDPRPNRAISPTCTTLVESFQNEEVNQRLLGAVETTYRPLLKLMKVFGIYFEDVPFNHIAHNCPNSKNKSYISRFYCGLVVAGLWLNVVIPLVSVLLGSNLYLFLLFVMWHLLAALKATTCLILLPLKEARKSRFQTFLSKVITIKTETVDFKKVKSRGRNHLIIFSCFLVFAFAGAVVMDRVVNINMGNYKPWNTWYGFRVTVLLFLTFGCGIWVLPLIFFSLSCLIMETLFDDLYAQMPGMEISELKSRHQKLCEVVEIADRMFSPLFFAIVGLYITLICFNFYHIVNLPQGDPYMFLSVTIFWVLVTASLLAIVMVLGSRINEKVEGIQQILQTLPVSTEEPGKILMIVLLLMDLQGQPRGLSIGGLTVIDKSLSLTIVGLIVSYLAVILSLPK